MGLDINIKANVHNRYDLQDNDQIWLNGRSIYRELVFDIMGIKDEQYGKDVPIDKLQAKKVLQYIVHHNQRAAEKLALWILLDADITFQADW